MAKVHAPNGAELSAAIADVLKASDETPKTKELQMKLLEEHKDWKVPERRVKKFLKRHLSQHADPSGADDDASVSSGVITEGPKRIFNKMFKKKKKSAASKPPETAPVPSPKAAPAPSPSPSPKKPDPKEEEPQSPEPEAAPKDHSRSVEQVYSDDNDGKKNDCHCSETCAIM